MTATSSAMQDTQASTGVKGASVTGAGAGSAGSAPHTGGCVGALQSLSRAVDHGMQRAFFKLGWAVATRPWTVVVIMCIVTAACATGMTQTESEARSEIVWNPENSCVAALLHCPALALVVDSAQVSCTRHGVSCACEGWTAALCRASVLGRAYKLCARLRTWRRASMCEHGGVACERAHLLT